MIMWHPKLHFSFCNLHNYIFIHHRHCGCAIKAFFTNEKMTTECSTRFLSMELTSKHGLLIKPGYEDRFDLWALGRPIHIEMSVSIRRKGCCLPSSSQEHERCSLGKTVISRPPGSLSVLWGNRLSVGDDDTGTKTPRTTDAAGDISTVQPNKTQ